jgi:hypothetical protein
MNDMKRTYLLLGLLLLLTGCADTVTFEQAASMEPVGFWHGLWHGLTVGFAFIGSLFSDNIAIYAIYNNGGWYDFGYFLGILALASAIND